MSVIDQLTLKSLSKDCTLLPFVLSAMFNEKQLSFTAKGRKSKTIPSDDVSTTMVKMLWRATLVMPFVEVSQSQSEIQSQSETQMRVPTSLPTLGRVPDTLLLALVSLGKSHDDWETTYLYNNGRSLYETLCSAFPSEIEFRTSWKDDVCIARIELDFMRKYNEHRSQDTGAMINRKYGRMLTHPRTYSSNFNTDIILFAMMCRDYLRAGNSALLEGGVTISHMILKALELTREHKKQELAECKQMIAACNGSVKQNGEEFTPELCDRMIAWLEFLVAAVDQEMHNKCGELCEYFDRAKVTLKDVDDRIAQHHQVMKDARQVPCIEHTAELATRMIDALTIVENVKKARDASDSICTSRLSPMYQYNMNIANTIVRYKSILESQAMQEIVRAKRTIACYEKNMDKFENNVRIIAEALQKFSSKYTCRATGYFSESDIAEFREISSGCENCDAFEQYMQRLNCDAFEQYMQCLNCCM